MAADVRDGIIRLAEDTMRSDNSGATMTASVKRVTQALNFFV